MRLRQALTGFLIGLGLMPLASRAASSQVPGAPVRRPRYRVTILGNPDSLGNALTNALIDRVAADAGGTYVRVASKREISGIVEFETWGRFSDDDFRETGVLLHTDLLFIVQAERLGDSLLVRTGIRSPIRAPVREFLGTITGPSIASIVDRVAPAILTDTTYRRMRGKDPN